MKNEQWIYDAMTNRDLWMMVYPDRTDQGLSATYGSMWMFSPDPNCPLGITGICMVFGRGVYTGRWSIDPNDTQPTPMNIVFDMKTSHGTFAGAVRWGVTICTYATIQYWQSNSETTYAELLSRVKSIAPRPL